MYKIVKDTHLNLEIGVATANNTFIPFDHANTDYQAYLAWVAEGNTPEPADEVTG